MLPNIKNLSDLILKIDEERESRTETFGITETLFNSNDLTSAVLGIGVVGKMILGVGVMNKMMSNEFAIRTAGTAKTAIGSTIDGLNAVKQAVYLILSIEADKYIIYPYTYGIHTVDLFGKPVYYVMAVIPERIKEALFRDDRITDVSDFEFEVNGNKLAVKFIVHTIYGDIEEEMVVQY